MPETLKSTHKTETFFCEFEYWQFYSRVYGLISGSSGEVVNSCTNFDQMNWGIKLTYNKLLCI